MLRLILYRTKIKIKTIRTNKYTKIVHIFHTMRENKSYKKLKIAA